MLAVAHGPLSTDEITMLAGLRAGREWVDDALGRLSQFLTSDDGLIQLFHASMAEFLVSTQVDAITWNQRVVDHAKACFGTAWGTAFPYVRRYLASHAATAGTLADLARDPDLLAAAEPASLAPLLSSAGPSLAGIARVYLHARPLLGGDPHANAAYLSEAASALNGAPAQATRILPSYRTPLASVAQDDSLFTLTGHTAPVRSVAFAAHQDGRLLLASGAEDGSVRLWDIDAGTQVGEPLSWEMPYDPWDPPPPVWSVAFGTDARGHLHLASATDSYGTVRVWDIDDGTHTTIGRPSPMTRSGVWVSFATHEGRLLLAFDVREGKGRSVQVYDTVTGEPACRPIAERGSPVAFAHDQRGRLLLVLDQGTNLEVWEPLTGTRLRKARTRHEGNMTQASFGAGRDGRLLVVSGDYAGHVLVLDPLTGRKVGKPHRSPKGTRALGVDGEGRLLLAVDAADGSIGVYNAITGKQVNGPLVGHADPVKSVAFGAGRDGRLLLASGGSDRTVRVWDPLTAGPPDVGQLPGHLGGATAVGFGTDRDGRLLLASCGRDQTVRIWDPLLRAAVTGPVRVRKNPYVRAIEQDPPDGVVFATAPDGRLMAASGSRYAAVLVWEALSVDDAEGRLLTGHESEVMSVAFAPSGDGRLLLASGSRDHTVRVWDAITGSMVIGPLTGHDDAVTSVAFYSGGEGLLLASGSWDREVRVWDALTGSMVIGPLTTRQRGTLSIAFGVGPGGRPQLAAGSTRYGEIRVWDLLTGSLAFGPLAGHEDEVTAVAFVRGPEGRPLLASGGNDSKVRIWDLSTATCTATLRRRTGVRSLAANGHMLAIADNEGVSVIELTGLNYQ